MVFHELLKNDGAFFRKSFPGHQIKIVFGRLLGPNEGAPYEKIISSF
jgi:hypothetical protein